MLFANTSTQLEVNNLPVETSGDHKEVTGTKLANKEVHGVSLLNKVLVGTSLLKEVRIGISNLLDQDKIGLNKIKHGLLRMNLHKSGVNQVTLLQLQLLNKTNQLRTGVSQPKLLLLQQLNLLKTGVNLNLGVTLLLSQ